MTDTTRDLRDEQIVAALAVKATVDGAAAVLTGWTERTVTAADVLERVLASARLQRVVAFRRGSGAQLPLAHRGAVQGHGRAASVAGAAVAEVTQPGSVPTESVHIVASKTSHEAWQLSE